MNRTIEEKDNYSGYKRLLAILAAIGLWVVSMYFSYKGFEFDSTTVLWFGFVLAGVVTVVELVFNTKLNKLNPTLLAAGIICYIYGVYTNISGFYILQHGSLDGFFTGTNWLIPIFSGLIAEILPEALFAWGIGAGNKGDFVGNVTEMLNENRPKENQMPHHSSNRYQEHNTSQPINDSLFQQMQPRKESFREKVEKRQQQYGKTRP